MKMNKLFSVAFAIVLVVLGASGASASSISLSVVPAASNTQPGSTDNFSYTITNNDTGVFLVAVGLNTDATQFAFFDTSFFDFPIVGPGPSLLTGPLATLTSDLNAPLGFNNSGNFDVQVQLYAGDPSDPANFLETIDLLAAYSITVTSPATTTPEPASFLLFASGLGLAFARRKKFAQG
jgi:hypothetical protein